MIMQTAQYNMVYDAKRGWAAREISNCEIKRMLSLVWIWLYIKSSNHTVDVWTKFWCWEYFVKLGTTILGLLFKCLIFFRIAWFVSVWNRLKICFNQLYGASNWITDSFFTEIPHLVRKCTKSNLRRIVDIPLQLRVTIAMLNQIET